MAFSALVYPPGPRLPSRLLPTAAIAISEAVDGQDETGDTTIPVTSMLGGDQVIGVLVFTTKAAIATCIVRPASDFLCGDGVLNVIANPVNNANNQYIIIYQRG